MSLSEMFGNVLKTELPITEGLDLRPEVVAVKTFLEPIIAMLPASDLYGKLELKDISEAFSSDDNIKQGHIVAMLSKIGIVDEKLVEFKSKIQDLISLTKV